MSHDPKINIRAAIAKADKKLKPQARHTIPPWVEKRARAREIAAASDPRDDPRRAKTLRDRRDKASKRGKSQLENTRSRERVQTWIALDRAEELVRERERRHGGCGADIWPLRPPVGRYEEMW